MIRLIRGKKASLQLILLAVLIMIILGIMIAKVLEMRAQVGQP